ncbi:unnamed protein product [Victoria cruziana]
MTTTRPTIISITARQIFDSRGNPTVEYVANLAGNKNLLLPVPAFNVINGGSHAGNKLVVQVNQIGPVTDGIEAVKMSRRAGWGIMASYCSGETEDTFIADLSVGLATGQIKTEAACRSERLAKYNQLLRIAEELESTAVYAAAKFRMPVDPY